MQFDFGQNWSDFSLKALNPERISQARVDFTQLFKDIDLAGKTFLDIGFGQGLSLLIAAEKGAIAAGCDINSKCKKVLEANRCLFPLLKPEVSIPLVIGSILADHEIAQIKKMSGTKGGVFDIVHSWGVLHHTGNMKKAISIAASLVDSGGYLIIAIYNRHWTSPIWKCIKAIYNRSPQIMKSIFIMFFYPVIFISKFIITKGNPLRQSRGMDFYYNVIDWVAGYPYEYANRDEIIDILKHDGFDCIRFIPAEVPTGCNEYVFVKRKL